METPMSDVDIASVSESSSSDTNKGYEVPRQRGSERRSFRRRYTAREHGIVSARVRPGYDVRLLDVSAGGALIETSYRLLPGCPIELSVAAGERRMSMRGRVLRCAVATLNQHLVSYRGAIGFDNALSWLTDDEGEWV